MVERANVIWLDESDKDKTNVIYMLIFPNWKYYIGQTRKKLYNRVFGDHSRISKQPQTKKERAVDKYKTFHVMVLDTCKDLDELNVKEQYWIELYDTFKNGYNSTTGGDVCKLSDETRKKIGKSHKNKIISDETRKKISESNRGKTLSDEHRKKMSEARKKRIISDETRKKISESNRGKIRSDEARKKISIKVKSIPDNIIFDSIGQCVLHYKSIHGSFNIYQYLDNGKIHKKSGQTFVRI